MVEGGRDYEVSIETERAWQSLSENSTILAVRRPRPMSGLGVHQSDHDSRW